MVRMPKLKTASKKPTAKPPTNAAITDAWIEKGPDAHWREVWKHALESAPQRREPHNADSVVAAHAVGVLFATSTDPVNVAQWGDWWLDEIDLGEWSKESVAELMQTIVRLAPPTARKVVLAALMEYMANELRFSVVANRMDILALEGEPSGGDAEQRLHREVGVSHRAASLARTL